MHENTCLNPYLSSARLGYHSSHIPYLTRSVTRSLVHSSTRTSSNRARFICLICQSVSQMFCSSVRQTTQLLILTASLTDPFCSLTHTFSHSPFAHHQLQVRRCSRSLLGPCLCTIRRASWHRAGGRGYGRGCGQGHLRGDVDQRRGDTCLCGLEGLDDGAHARLGVGDAEVHGACLPDVLRPRVGLAQAREVGP